MMDEKIECVNGKRVWLLTHNNADFDGRLSLGVLKELYENPKVLFWEGGYINVASGSNVLIFLDCYPQNDLKRIFQEKGIEFIIYDHHPHGSFPDPTDREYPLKTTASILMEKFGERLKEKLNLTEEKIRELVRWSKRADFKTGGDPMNFSNIIREMNLEYSDFRVQNWTEGMIEASFSELNAAELEEGKKFFLEVVNGFLKNATAAKEIFEGFISRVGKSEVFQDTMNIVSRTSAILKKFGRKQAKAWLLSAFMAIENGQRRFQEATTETKEKATIAANGSSLVIMAVTDNPEFSSAARAYGRKVYKREPKVVKFRPNNKGFQIFGDGKDDLREVVQAIRVLILKARGKEVPFDRKILQEEGTLPGTEPLYYHRAQYSAVLWGSFTKPNVRPVDISEEQLKSVVMIVLDREFLPKECRESRDCLKDECTIYKYRLQRCSIKRNQNSNPQNKMNGLNFSNPLITVIRK